MAKTMVDGECYDFDNITEWDIPHMEWLFNNLARIPRFNGEYGPACNVLSHSVGMAMEATTAQQAIACLAHDMSEIWVSDLVSPIKTLIGRDNLIKMTDAEHQIIEAISVKHFDGIEITGYKQLDIESCYREIYHHGGEKHYNTAIWIDNVAPVLAHRRTHINKYVNSVPSLTDLAMDIYQRAITQLRGR